MNPANRPVLGMILKGYPRISETFISNEILLLERLGITIRIFSMRKPRESFCHDSVKEIQAAVDYLPESLLLNLPRLVYRFLLLFIRQPRPCFHALKLALGRFRRTRKTATLKHLLQASYLVQHLLPGSGVVHLHAHFAHSPASVAMFSALLSGLEFSFTAHAKDIYTSDPRQLLEKLDQARFVVTCTEYNRRHLKALAGSDRVPIYRVYHGIDIRLFQATKDRRNPSDPLQLLTVARMTPKKGLPTVFQAVRHLLDHGVAVKHALIGDGEARQEVLEALHRLGLGAVTRWLGTQPHHVVVEHYRRADVFVLGCEIAANGDRDGIPNVLLESMAVGTPVVATTVSAIPELVRDGVTGLLVPPGNPEAMAQAITRLARDESLRAMIVHHAKDTVSRNFDNRELIKELARIYRREIPGLG